MNHLSRFSILGALCALSATVSGAPINQDFESGLAGWTSLGNVNATGAATVETNFPIKDVVPFQSLMARLVSNDGRDHGASTGDYKPPSNAADLDAFFGLSAGTLATSYQAHNGSGIKQTFLGSVGDVLQQSYNFFSTEEPVVGLNDTAFAVITGPGVIKLISLANSLGVGGLVGDPGTSGWIKFEYTLPADGEYTIGFGVVNNWGYDELEPDYKYDAELFLDDFRGVPEPASLALLGLGLACVGGLRRKRAGRL